MNLKGNCTSYFQWELRKAVWNEQDAVGILDLKREGPDDQAADFMLCAIRRTTWKIFLGRTVYLYCKHLHL